MQQTLSQHKDYFGILRFPEDRLIILVSLNSLKPEENIQRTPPYEVPLPTPTKSGVRRSLLYHQVKANPASKDAAIAVRRLVANLLFACVAFRLHCARTILSYPSPLM